MITRFSVRTKLLPTVAEVGSILMASGGTVDPEVARKHLAIRALFTYLKQAGPDDAKWPSLAALTTGDRELHFTLGRTTDGCWVAARLFEIATHTASALVANWLRSRRGRGPTAPENALQSLKWLHAHLGFQFNTDDELVLAFGTVTGDHIERQAVPIHLVTIGAKR